MRRNETRAARAGAFVLDSTRERETGSGARAGVGLGPVRRTRAMDVIVAKKDLIRLFGRTQGVADKKSTMPILSNVLIQAEVGGTLRASATDLFMAVTAQVQGEVTRAGSLA